MFLGTFQNNGRGKGFAMERETRVLMFFDIDIIPTGIGEMNRGMKPSNLPKVTELLNNRTED